MQAGSEVTLVIFTCNGREHLLKQTFDSFKKACSFDFAKTVLAIDGKISEHIIDQVSPDIVIQSTERKGYVNSIMLALKVIDSPYIFWLEDDWSFPVNIPVAEFLTLLVNDKLFQVVLSKMELDATFTPYKGNLFIPTDSFSANPGISRTAVLKQCFLEIANAKKGDDTRLLGFETFIANRLNEKKLTTLRYFNNGQEAVIHTGELESSAREYHMINSLDAEKSAIKKQYISMFGIEKITFKSKFGMFVRLWLATFSLSFRLWRIREAYDFAFRIYLASLRKFKT
jgi:hypothetical protein